jgi:hypothetical protein
MMKNILLAGVWFLASSFVLSDNLFDEKTIKQTIQYFLENRLRAFEKLDDAKLSELFAQDAVVSESGEVKRNLGTYIGELKQRYSKLQFSNYRLVSLKINPPYVYTTETYDYEFTERGGRHAKQGMGVVSIIFEKAEGRWQITDYHASHREVLP